MGGCRQLPPAVCILAGPPPPPVGGGGGGRRADRLDRSGAHVAADPVRSQPFAYAMARAAPANGPHLVRGGGGGGADPIHRGLVG